MEKILSEWNQYNKELSLHFTNRDRDRALPVMRNAIELFKQFLFESNGLDQDSNRIEDCKLKPVNVRERLEFVSSMPALFQSYKQLAELFAEQEKQYARKAALIQVKNKRPD
ncbi:YpoC family protein [Mesobacillus thioparans]|uniref:YpoC family protein n=1 Tax=Mesobacillus thioparans TaxID=370439 RepID=UPI0039EE0015